MAALVRAVLSARRAFKAVLSLALMAFLMSSGMRLAVSLMALSYHGHRPSQGKPCNTWNS